MLAVILGVDWLSSSSSCRSCSWNGGEIRDGPATGASSPFDGFMCECGLRSLRRDGIGVSIGRRGPTGEKLLVLVAWVVEHAGKARTGVVCGSPKLAATINPYSRASGSQIDLFTRRAQAPPKQAVDSLHVHQVARSSNSSTKYSG